MRRLLLALPALLLAASGLALLCPVPVLAEPIGGHAMLPSGSNNVPVTAENNILQDKVTAGNYPYANITVNAKGVITSIISGSAPADTLFPCQSPPNSLQYNAAGAFECATVDNGLDFTGGVLSLKQLFDDQSGGDYTILTGDGAKTIEVGAHTYTLPQAGTTGFATGWGSGVLNTGSGNATLSTTTSIFKGAGGGTSLTVRPGDAVFPASDGTDYVTLPIFNYIGMSSGLPVIGGGSGAGLTTGTRSGNTTQFVTTTGSQTSGRCVEIDASGNHIAGAAGCGTGAGSVTSVGLSGPGGIFGITGSPVTTSGTLGFTNTGTSGGVPYFSSGSVLSSSAALTANMPVIGGGAGSAPTVGTVSGNTTQFVTTTGTQTSGRCVQIDANGNHVATGSACGSGSSSVVACADLSDDGTACTANTGTSGATLPFLNGTNTWSGAQTFAETKGSSVETSATAYTIPACGKTYIFTAASTVTVTIPASLAPASGTICPFALMQHGAGAVVLTGSAVSAATRVSRQSYTQIAGQYGVVGVTLTTISAVATANIIGDGS